jgi:type VI secretion system secreted protein Hcp
MTDETGFNLPRRTMLASALGLGAAGTLYDASPAMAIPSDPSSQFWVKVDTITGSSAGARHPNTIDVLTWSFGTDSSLDPIKGGGGAASGKSKPRDFVFVKRMDRSSPLLHQACAKGTHLKKVDLWAAQGEGSFDYLHAVFEDVAVTSYATAPSETDGFPIDVVHVAFAKITQSFTSQNPAGGIGETVTFGFDFIKNKST